MTEGHHFKTIACQLSRQLRRVPTIESDLVDRVPLSIRADALVEHVVGDDVAVGRFDECLANAHVVRNTILVNSLMNVIPGNPEPAQYLPRFIVFDWGKYQDKCGKIG